MEKSHTYEPSNKKIKFSPSAVQTLIEQEVYVAKRNEAKLQSLVEAIQNADQGIDYGSALQKLEARVDKLTKRAETVLTYIVQSQGKTDNNVSRDNCGNEVVDGTLQNGTSLGCSEGFSQMMDTTKNTLKKMQENSDVLKAAIAGFKADPPPSLVVKKEKENDHCPGIETINLEEPKSQCKEESRPSANNISENTSSDETVLSYPPLPTFAFPTDLNMEAASYNIPQKPEVHLAFIREPAGLSVLWKVADEDPSAPPMDSYSIYMATEKVQDSGIFSKWFLVGAVKAFKLPMCAMISKYKRRCKLCLAVVGKDTFGRYGPFSEIVTAVVP